MTFLDFLKRAGLSAVLLMIAAYVWAQPRAAAGGFATISKVSETRNLFLSADSRAYHIHLAAPSAGTTALQKSNIRRTRRNQPLRIGFEREIGEGARKIRLGDLPWNTLADGAIAARLSVTSENAASIRLKLELTGDAKAEVRMVGSDSAEVFSMANEELKSVGGSWSPILEGAGATVDIRLPDGVILDGYLVVHRVGHILVAPNRLKLLSDVGTSGSCERDAACSTSLASQHAASSVVQTVVENQGFVVLCTGSLLNSTPQTNVPYLLTAYHCFDDDRSRTADEVQAIANTLTTYWFFDAAACEGDQAAEYKQVGGGGTVLYQALDLDVMFLRMRNDPPTGAWFSAWDANPIPSGTQAIVIHHPEGDLKKLTTGITEGYVPADGRGSFISVLYSSGSTEPGSSGAPLLTCAATSANCADYAVRGALWGGDAACANPAGTDQYSRLDLAYPYIAKFLVPNTTFATGAGTAVEFYNVDLDHFFLTADANEQVAVDNGGGGPGWFRTGYSFRTMTSGSSFAAPVCRFYGSIVPGPNSHFYTLDVGECQFLKDLQTVIPSSQPRWNFEAIAFWNLPPENASCPAGTVAVYRYYNNGYPVKDSNHRFVTSLSPNAFMLDQGWQFEGVAMCAPQ